MTDELTERMIEAVQESDELTPAEKETSITFSKDEDDARVTTREAGLMRRLLALDDTEIRWIMQKSSEGPVRVKSGDLEEEFDGRRRLVGLHVLVPIGCLKISEGPRKSSGHAAVVSEM